MGIGERLGRLIWWRILRGMRKPRGRFLRSLEGLGVEQRGRALAAFSKQEKFARRVGPKLLVGTINGFFLVLAAVTLYSLVEVGQILGWVPTVDEIQRAVQR